MLTSVLLFATAYVGSRLCTCIVRAIPSGDLCVACAEVVGFT
jgi:hypothetical protein